LTIDFAAAAMFEMVDLHGHRMVGGNAFPRAAMASSDMHIGWSFRCNQRR
jgi:hypothetical protein